MIFSGLAFLALFVSICIKDRKKSLCVQAMNCFFESVYDFIISAFTGAILSIINVLRTILFINKEEYGKKFYLFLLFLFEGIIITNCCISWAGPISLLPTIGSMIRTYCLWQSDMKLVRMSGITTGVFYGSYYIYYNSWFMVLGDVILLLIGIFEVYKNDIAKNEKKITVTA